MVAQLHIRYSLISSSHLADRHSPSALRRCQWCALYLNPSAARACSVLTFIRVDGPVLMDGRPRPPQKAVSASFPREDGLCRSRAGRHPASHRCSSSSATSRPRPTRLACPPADLVEWKGFADYTHTPCIYSALVFRRCRKATCSTDSTCGGKNPGTRTTVLPPEPVQRGLSPELGW